jgi:hypothetical protein
VRRRGRRDPVSFDQNEVDGNLEIDARAGGQRRAGAQCRSNAPCRACCWWQCAPSSSPSPSHTTKVLCMRITHTPNPPLCFVGFGWLQQKVMHESACMRRFCLVRIHADSLAISLTLFHKKYTHPLLPTVLPRSFRSR